MTCLRRGILALSLRTAIGMAHAATPVPADAVPTGRLPRTVVPTLVELELKIDPRKERFNGRTRIQATVAAPTSVIWMHGNRLKIGRAEAVLSDGRRIALTSESAHVSGVLRLSAASELPAGKATIEIDYDAPFGELQGAYRVKSDGRDYIVTQMEALGARDTFPGFDEPSFKQPWDITLIVPEQDVAVANTAEVDRKRLPDGWTQVRFRRTEALPSYLIAFAVGPWELQKGPDIAPRGERKTPLALRGVAAYGQGAKMKYSLANTPAIVHALEDYFGIPYPFDKLDNLGAPDFAVGAMENPGLIVYRDKLLFPDENSSVGERQAYWNVSAHELAHQWFGDLVTMQWWDDLWLNEAFASWMGNKIAGQLQPQFHTDRTILQGALAAMSADSLESTRRIHQPISDFTEINAAFDSITYQKGAAVLAMFERYVGEAPFRDGVREYLKRHSRANATSTDLIDSIAARSQAPVDVKSSFLSFIDQPGVPYLQVDVDCTQRTPALQLSQQRYVPLGSTASAAQTWGIPLCVRYADGDTVRDQCGLVSDTQTRFELKDAKQCPAWVMPNAHGNGYYRFALKPKWQASLANAFGRLDEREQRVYADSVIAAYNAGQLTPQQVLATLPRFAAVQTRQTAVAGLDEISWIKQQLLTDPKRREAFLSQAAQIYRPRLQQLGLEPRSGEADDDRLLRVTLVDTFVEVFKDAAVRAALLPKGRAVLGLDGDGKLAPDAVSKDLRGAALVVAVQEGGQAAFDSAERHLRASQDPVVRVQLVKALGSVDDAALAERARGWLLEGDTLRRNEIVDLLGAQGAIESQRAGMRDWMDRRFDPIAKRVAPYGAYLVNFYAVGLCGEDDAKKVDRTFSERLSTMEGGPRRLKQLSESLRLCGAARTARKDLPLTFAKQP